MGEQSVKNIVRPVRVYALRSETIAELPVGSVPLAAPTRRRSIVAPVAAAVAAVLVIAVLRGGSGRPKDHSRTTATVAAATTARLLSPSSHRACRSSCCPSPISATTRTSNILPTAITEDLTTDLSRIAGMLVISRNTAFTYRNKPIDTKQIGRELGVRYVLEGSVRRSGNQVRVNAQLIDAETDAHLWAERFDRDTGDLFALQDEITSRIAVALNLEVTGREAARPTEHPDALDYILRGRAAYWKPPSREQRAETISLFERALALDPGSVEAKSSLANRLAARALEGWTNSAAADVARAEELAKRLGDIAT